MDRLCLGTAQLGMEYGIANIIGKPSDKSIAEIVQTAIENGVSYFDTASSYGKSEELLGKSFDNFQTGKEIKILTKLPTEYVHKSLSALEDVIQLSLSRLRLNSLWCLYTHRESNIPNWDEFGYSVNKLKNQGLLKYIGVSVYTVEDAIRYTRNKNVDIIQVPTNVLDRRFLDSGFFKKAENAGKNVFIRSIFLQGLFFLGNDDLGKKDMIWAEGYLEYLKKYISQNNFNLKQFAIKGVLQKFPKTILVMGVESPQQLRDNISLLNSPDINSEIVEQWWADLPVFPDRLLNPSLWKKANA